MKKFFTTLKNIWSIEELRNRIIFTLSILMLFRFGCYVVLPGVMPAVLEANSSSGGGGILDLLNAFTGGAFNRAGVFALGIMPYISASIIVQLLGFAVPYFQKLQKTEGESGRKKLTQITRWLTVAITLVQAAGYLTYINSFGAIDPSVDPFVFWVCNIIILTAGVILAMWLGERITDRGIGNGISLLIMIGIIAILPMSFAAEIDLRLSGGTGGLVAFVLVLAALVAVTLVTIMIIQAVRRIPLQYAKRMVGRGQSAAPVVGVRDYLPVKVNAAGVMPIIFAQALMFLPATIAPLFSGTSDNPSWWTTALSDFTSGPYNVIYFFLVVLFTYIYTALIVNPQQHSEYLKRQNAFIPGVKPGKSTADFIDTVTTRVTLPGSIFLGLISIMPAFAAAFGVNTGFAMFFGGTSLLIMVGVVLDTLQQIESHLLMRRYDGLVKTGRVKGRKSGMTVGAPM